MIPDSNPSTNPPEKCKLTQEETNLLMSKLDLSGIKDWKPEEQKEVKDSYFRVWVLVCSQRYRFGKNR